MRLLPRSKALLAAAGALLLLALVSLRALPAILGLALVAFHALRAASFRARARRVHLTARRRALAPVHHEDAPVEVDTVVEGDAAGLATRIDARPPPGLVPWSDAPPREGPEVRSTLRAQRQGSYSFGDVHVRLEDPARLFAHELAVPAPLRVHVHVSRRRLEEARQASRRHRLEASRGDPLGRLLREFEFAGVRDYAGGDRLRDLDWKRASRLDRLMTRTYEKDLEATIVVVLDASRTMRQRRGGGEGKLSRATGLCMEAAQMALSQGYRVGVLVVDERRVLDEAPPSASAASLRALARRLSELPPSFDVERRLDVGGLARVGAADPFLERLARLHPRAQPAARSFLHAAQRLCARHAPGGLLVVALTDLESDPGALAQAVAALRERRHAVVCGVLSGEAYMAAPRAPRLHEAEQAYRELETREILSRLLAARGARVVEMPPGAGVADLLALSGPAKAPAPRPGRPTSSGG